MLPLFQTVIAVAVSAAGISDVSQRLSEPPDLVFARASSETALKGEVLKRLFGKEHYDWSVDLEEGTIVFASATKTVSAPVQVIGTYNTLDGTFLWGWDHPSVSEARGADARLARAFGERNRLPSFTQRKIECSEEEAWRFTAVALYLSGAQGAYRGPSGTTLVFMTYGTLEISPKR